MKPRKPIAWRRRAAPAQVAARFNEWLKRRLWEDGLVLLSDEAHPIRQDDPGLLAWQQKVVGSV